MSLQEADILRLTTAFYAKVRADEFIGPIFTAKIKAENWDRHVSHIADFWSSIFLKTDRFTGNPMSKHLELNDIGPQHFDHWLMLFQQTAEETLDPWHSIEFIKMANRIGQSLQMGLAFNHRKKGFINHPFTDFEPNPSQSKID